MRVFLTGATGFVGSRILPELIAAGHTVVGLARSDEASRRLEQAGAEVHRGSLEQAETLAAGSAQADAVIHTAFDHDFSRFQANCDKDARVIEAMADAVAGTGKPLIFTSGTGMGSKGPGQFATEDFVDWNNPNPRIASERAGERGRERGASVAVVRLPQVHNETRYGLVSHLVDVARGKRASGYLGDGEQRWPAAHIDDVARLYRLALERHEGGVRYHASAESGIPMRVIAKAIGTGLGVPIIALTAEQAAEYFGPLALFVGLDMPVSSEWTSHRLRWEPRGPGMIEVLRAIGDAKQPSA